MTLNLFEQFNSPAIMGIPLIAMALLAPVMLLSLYPHQWLQDRLSAAQTEVINEITRQFFSPIKAPGHKWALMMVTLTIYLITLNVLGLLPFTFTPTTQLSASLGIAMPMWLLTVLVGLRNQPNQAFAHLLPESTPPALVPVLIIIETISLFIRPLALGVRITANLTAGHLLINLMASGMIFISSHSMLAGLTVGLLLLLLNILEFAVAVIQGYVFVLLLSLYLQENT
uniref:ATP synthase F0 subunit 6 n=1 Tax=Pegasus laternarius TaxID=1888206 RepID=UPI00286A4ECB|nr:ATP synthase F0 subunit 6 [Pegasus laternarius]WKY95812.1 ATP synthase F0 subunit 6 [Pegasus laternarius]